MKIYRGVRNILISKIDPLYRSQDADSWYLTYGAATSYAVDKKLAEDYCQSGRSLDENFGFLLEYNFDSHKIFYINEKHYFDEDDNEAGFWINNDFVESKQLARVVNDLGYEAVEFDLELAGFEHIMLLPNCKPSQLELCEIKLFVNNKKLKKQLEKLNLLKQDEYFVVLSHQVAEVDDLLKDFIS